MTSVFESYRGLGVFQRVKLIQKGILEKRTLNLEKFMRLNQQMCQKQTFVLNIILMMLSF
jgi:hypothetical protein